MCEGNDVHGFNKAKSARNNSYAPYSNYYVGCALKAKSGKIYSGCNIENHGIQGVYSERVAFARAISEGERKFEHIVGSSLDSLDECLPCEYCRQFMSEFADEILKYMHYQKMIKQQNIKWKICFHIVLSYKQNILIINI